ncbi:finTRIM family, member 16 isoform X1 [Silurus meridionalis]|nr:finTRIM family, member 16 isoform X1 [Silurus meridionalis]
MISSMEKMRSEVKEMIRAQEEAELSGAERLLEQLEQEITDLQRRVTELEQLSHTHDHVYFLQSFKSLCVSAGCRSPPGKRPDFHTSSITVHQHHLSDGMRKYFSDLKKKLEEFCEVKFNKIPAQDSCYLTLDPNTAHRNLILSEKNRAVRDSERKQQISDHPERFDYWTQVLCEESVCGRCYWEVEWRTLDPNTAHRNLILSEKNRAVRDSEGEQQNSDHPERFHSWPQVLCEESVCGRCYWEVEWSGVGVNISVSYKDIRRKGRGDDCRFGRNNQSWSLRCSSSSLCFFHNNIETDLRVPSPSRIGVYVNHSAGTLSFYSVSDTMKLLHKVQTTFTQPLYAGFRLPYFSFDKSTVRLCDPE